MLRNQLDTSPSENRTSEEDVELREDACEPPNKNDEMEILNPFFNVNSSFKKRFNFGVSLFFTQLLSNNPFSDWKLWNLVAPHLYLGTIPSVTQAKCLKEAIPNLKLVVSVVEPFELKGKAWPFDLDIQSPQNWRDMNVDHYLLPVEDFTTIVAEENVYEAIKKIHQCILVGEDVYVHCKAGRGRSAFICACYLAVYGSGDEVLKPHSAPAEVYSYLQSKRKQVSLKKDGINKIQSIKDHHEVIENKRPKLAYETSDSSLTEKLNQYLAFVETKKEIAQLLYFKALSEYAADKCNSKRAVHIRSFLNDVRDAKNANWFFDFFNGSGPLKALLEARPLNGFMGTGLPKSRNDIVMGLKKELEKMIVKDVKCSKKELHELILSRKVESLGLSK